MSELCVIELNCQIIITENQYILYLKGVCRYVYLFFCMTWGKQNIFDAGKLYKTPDRDNC